MQIVDFAQKRIVEYRKSPILCCRFVDFEGHCRRRFDGGKVCRMQNLVVKKLQILSTILDVDLPNFDCRI